MSIHSYIEKLRAKPESARKRIAVIGTIIGFFVFVAIWLVSFKEMNKPVESSADPAAASLNDLKNNFQDGKDSIQNMMQQLPASSTGGPRQAGEAGTGSQTENTPTIPSELTTPEDNSQNQLIDPSSGNNLQNPSDTPVQNNTSQTDQNNPGAPQLP